jgi:hypothetical protein
MVRWFCATWSNMCAYAHIRIYLRATWIVHFPPRSTYLSPVTAIISAHVRICACIIANDILRTYHGTYHSYDFPPYS